MDLIQSISWDPPFPWLEIKSNVSREFLADRKGCSMFILLVENHSPLQLGYHFKKLLAFMCRMQWDVKIYDRLKQICSFRVKICISVITVCMNQMNITLMEYFQSLLGLCLEKQKGQKHGDFVFLCVSILAPHVLYHVGQYNLHEC